MSFSLILTSILTASEPTLESDSMARASELLDLVKSPMAVATGVLVAFASAQLGRNTSGTVDRPRTMWAAAAAVAALALSTAVVAVMTPLAWRVIITNFGNHVETRLLVYVMTYGVAIGTLVYCGWTSRRCLAHLGVGPFGTRRRRGS